jgi:calcineurin-like phosphoesterase family protein
MHESLIKRWNATVPSYGIVYVLGDVGFAKGDLIKSVLSRMNGTKILILGNHDGSVGKMYDSGFTLVLNGTTLYLGNHRLELTHCPPRGVWRENTAGMRGSDGTENWHGERRHHKFSKQYDPNSFWLHGHTHKKPTERTLNRMFDVGIDANHYTPVSMGTIESWIALMSKSNGQKPE